MASIQRGTYEYENDKGEDVLIEIAYEVGLSNASPTDRLTKGGFSGSVNTCNSITRRKLKPRYVMYTFGTDNVYRVYVKDRTTFETLIKDDSNVNSYCGECSGC